MKSYQQDFYSKLVETRNWMKIIELNKSGVHWSKFKTKTGYPLLGMAIKSQPNELKLLIQNGLKIQNEELPSGQIFNPIIEAITNNSDQNLVILLKNKQSPNILFEGKTPIQITSHRHSISQTKILLDFNADVNLNKEDFSPLYYWIKNLKTSIHSCTEYIAIISRAKLTKSILEKTIQFNKNDLKDVKDILSELELDLINLKKDYQNNFDEIDYVISNSRKKIILQENSISLY